MLVRSRYNDLRTWNFFGATGAGADADVDVDDGVFPSKFLNHAFFVSSAATVALIESRPLLSGGANPLSLLDPGRLPSRVVLLFSFDRVSSENEALFSLDIILGDGSVVEDFLDSNSPDIFLVASLPKEIFR